VQRTAGRLRDSDAAVNEEVVNLSSIPEKPGKFRAAWELIKGTANEWWNDDTLRLAASLAFYTIFSLAPVLLIAIGGASFFVERQAAVDQIVMEVRRMVGPQGAQAVREVIGAAAGFGKNAWAIGIGVVTFFLGASVVFAELQSALNKIWDVEVKTDRGVLARLVLDRFRSFTIALGVGFLLLVSLVFSAGINYLQHSLTTAMPGLPVLWQILNSLASFLIATLLFAMIYKYLPDAKITWRDVGIGAAVTAGLFVLGKELIGLYLGQTAAASAFGAAGSFVVLLLWIYYSALIVFFGAEFTQVYTRRHGSRIHAEEFAERTGRKPDKM
jgi:membrane protein